MDNWKWNPDKNEAEPMTSTEFGGEGFVVDPNRRLRIWSFIFIVIALSFGMCVGLFLCEY